MTTVQLFHVALVDLNLVGQLQRVDTAFEKLCGKAVSSACAPVMSAGAVVMGKKGGGLWGGCRYDRGRVFVWSAENE